MMTWDGYVKLAVLSDALRILLLLLWWCSFSSSCSLLICYPLLYLCLPMNCVPKYPAQPDKVIALVVANIAICTCAHDLTSLNMSWMQNLAQIHCFYII